MISEDKISKTRYFTGFFYAHAHFRIKLITFAHQSINFMHRMISFRILLPVFACSLFIACSQQQEKHLAKLNGETQGTYYAVTYYSSDTTNIQPQIDSLLRRFDSSASVYKPNSIISRFNNNDSLVQADEIYTTIFHKAMEVSGNTGGAFDITVGPLVNAWGFGFTDRMKVDQELIDSLKQYIGYEKVKLENGRLIKSSPGIRIDYNAIAQGYAVDLVANFLAAKGIESYLVDIGGEVVARGLKPDGSNWNVGIELPSATADDSQQVQAVVMLKDMALSTSGSYRKYFEENGVRYSHTIDPFTGYPVKHSLLSVSVLAKDCITADAYSTAFMVMGVDKAKSYLESHPGLDAYFIFSTADGSMGTYYTKGFNSILHKD